MSWKDALLPEFNCEGEIRGKLRRAKKGDMRAITWLMNVETSPEVEESDRNDAKRALYIVYMLQHLRKVADSEIRKTLQATLGPEKERKERAENALRERAEGANRKKSASANAALDFLVFKRKFTEVV